MIKEHPWHSSFKPTWTTTLGQSALTAANATAQHLNYDIRHPRDKHDSISTYFDSVPPSCAALLVYDLPYPMVWNEAYSHNLRVWPCLPRTTAHVSTPFLFNPNPKKR